MDNASLKMYNSCTDPIFLPKRQNERLSLRLNVNLTSLRKSSILKRLAPYRYS
jgi:hypothetical protein